MQQFSQPLISIAQKEDAIAITNLLNVAYRGPASKQGWTTEADLIAGETRANVEMVQALLLQPETIFLVYKDQNKVIGCVNLQKHGSKIYLGMFAILPQMQTGGLGKQLLKASEEYAINLKCTAIYMTVISLRSELIDWYQRHGYQDMGITKPFIEDAITGKHLRKLEFMVLEKKLNP